MPESGNFKGRAVSKEYVTWRVMTEAGNPANLSDVVTAVLKMINKKTKASKLFALDDSPQQFFITDEEGGIVELRPLDTDFPGASAFTFFIKFVDSAGKEFTVPRDKNYYYQLIADIA